ncbi:uncharacterized protein RJT21DRAFT_11050 [Scheffersomyces amazonensis]|uniref:uncharacterized protein n=1 Tax=Scheffersomyces amazonensis TaxID=1078765 RepID=UPI00315D98D0
MTDIDQPYEDPILKLTHDPNLNRDKEKSNLLTLLINQFPLTERKISRLCQTSVTILQTLEKSNLIFKSWEFLSLDFSSNDHFNHKDFKIKEFNYGIADKVINKCQELNIKIMKISLDIDHITKSSKTLSPIEYISDSGTLLTSLLLRCIKLKNDISSNLSTSYSKARLICIGKELETLLSSNNDSKDDKTLESYKSFIISLLKQLNNAIDNNDNEAKYECLEVINDLEQMFEAYKLDKMKDSIIKQHQQQHHEKDLLQIKHQAHAHAHAHTPSSRQSDEDEVFYEDDDLYSEFGGSSMYTSTVSQAPMVHSITKHHNHETDASTVSSPRRRGSFSSMSTSAALQKSTITEELPYLMSAFNSAKTIEEDVIHFKEKGKDEELKHHSTIRSPSTTSTSTSTSTTTNSHKKEEIKSNSNSKSNIKHKPIFSHKANLPDTSLYTQNTVMPQLQGSLTSASSYIYANTSLLSKLGIKPQVITTNMTNKELTDSSKSKSNPLQITSASQEEIDEHNKENKTRFITPLTKENLNTHTLLKLNDEVDNEID